jgi:hypothetical protein
VRCSLYWVKDKERGPFFLEWGFGVRPGVECGTQIPVTRPLGGPYY